MNNVSEYIYRRADSGVFRYRRRVPTELVSSFGKTQISISLKTKDENTALKKAAQVNNEIEIMLDELRITGGNLEERRYQKAKNIARMNGFDYVHISKLVENASAQEINERLASLPADPALLQKEVEKFDALLGLHDEPEIMLSDCFDKFVDFTKSERLNKSPAQAKRFIQPKETAFNNFISFVKNKPLGELSRNDVLNYREYIMGKLESKEWSANTFNKQFTHLRVIFKTIEETLQLKLGLEDLFKNLAAKERKEQRASFGIDHVKNVLLNPANFSGLNEQAYAVIPIMANTGMRLTEVCGLEESDIYLNAPIPYVHIRPKEDMELKTPHSERRIPLVGGALWAFKKYPTGLTNYFRKNDSLSGCINKYMDENNLKEIIDGKKATIYSLRHTFQDNLRIHKIDERLQCELMGHKYSRPKYGAPSLDELLEVIEKFAYKLKNTE